MKYTYLLINIASVFFPLILSFDKRVRFAKSWPALWPGLLITGAFFLIWDMIFTKYGVWSFNPHYIMGPNLGGLPFEEILFFFTIPFACIFVYACLNYYIKWQISFKISKVINYVLVISCLPILVIYHQRLYTLITFCLLLFLLPWLQFVVKANWFSRFYMSYLVSLIPFYLVNGLLTSIPVVMYNNQQNMSIRVGTIPVEDHFYLMALLLMNIGFFEFFKKRKSLA